MKLKKLLIIGLIICTLCAVMLVSCNNGSEESTTVAETTAAEATTVAEATTAAEETTEEEATTEQETEPATEEITEAQTEEVTEEEKKAVLYQLAPENTSLMMCYVIKTKNDKLIVIDGGIDGEGLENDPYLPTALRAIAGVGENGYFEVEAWFLTHAHCDHIYELSKMLRDYTTESNYKINNIYFDFPAFGSESYAGTNSDLAKSKLRENLNAYGQVIGAECADGKDYYDTLNGSVINEEAINNGLEFNIDGIRIEVLQTWSIDDGFSNVNDTSLVTRFWIDGQSVLFLADAGPIAGERLLNTYGDKLKSDIVQMAHHGQAGVEKDVYAAIDAQVHLWPTPYWVWKNQNNNYAIDTTREWLYGETFQKPDEYNLVAGRSKYPKKVTSVSAWEAILDYVSIEFPYVLPYRESSLNK